jgi:hypothetical protein
VVVVIAGRLVAEQEELPASAALLYFEAKDY